MLPTWVLVLVYWFIIGSIVALVIAPQLKNSTLEIDPNE